MLADLEYDGSRALVADGGRWMVDGGRRRAGLGRPFRPWSANWPGVWSLHNGQETLANGHGLWDASRPAEPMCRARIESGECRGSSVECLGPHVFGGAPCVQRLVQCLVFSVQCSVSSIQHPVPAVGVSRPASRVQHPVSHVSCLVPRTSSSPADP